MEDGCDVRSSGAGAAQRVPFNLPEDASCNKTQLQQTQPASWDPQNPCSQKQLILVPSALHYDGHHSCASEYIFQASIVMVKHFGEHVIYNFLSPD
jgi:hypothetical protein